MVVVVVVVNCCRCAWEVVVVVEIVPEIRRKPYTVFAEILKANYGQVCLTHHSVATDKATLVMRPPANPVTTAHPVSPGTFSSL